MTTTAAQRQFYKGIVSYGALGVLPTLPGVSLNVNENYAIPPIIGNYWQWNFGQGFINPTLETSFVFRDVSTELMTPSSTGTTPANFFDYAHMRSNDGAHDVASIGNITIQPSGTGDALVLMNAKIASYQMSCSKGGEIVIRASFVGTGVTTLGTALTFAGWSNANILRFKNVSFASPLDNQVWEWGYNFSNNMTPCMALNGSEFPADQNAGMQTASMNISTQIATTNRPDNGTFPVPGTLAPIVVIIAGTTKTLTATFPNPINNTKRNRQIASGRVMQASQYTLLGGDGISSSPANIVIA